MNSSLYEIIALVASEPTRQAKLEAAYSAVTSKYSGGKLKTLTHIWQLRLRSISAIWAKEEFLHCTHLNQLIRHILLKTEAFVPADFKTRWTLLWGISPHQYLTVRIDDRWISVDAWAAFRGIPLGDHAHGFHTRG